jgi:predicted nuclease with TOPRIM domain
VLIEKLSKVTK